MNSHDHHKHIHPGRPSSFFFNANDVLDRLDLKEGGTLLDAGCGDGFISISASKLVGESGLVFAVDIDTHSIDTLNQVIERNKIENIEAIKADISKTLPIENNIIDLCFMVNVFHGIVENNEVDLVLKEIKRVVKPDSDFAIVDFKKIESMPGPPISIRLSPEQLESILREYDFEKRNYFEIGRYHYAAVFRNL
jgi:ubiquinone/menaquinone biosynthesis C-methylase UbiE